LLCDARNAPQMNLRQNNNTKICHLMNFLVGLIKFLSQKFNVSGR
jgi:hypothetical protein